jgi:peptidoglycan/LPS O-acetylase OafA/YrhL
MLLWVIGLCLAAMSLVLRIAAKLGASMSSITSDDNARGAPIVSSPSTGENFRTKTQIFGIDILRFLAAVIVAFYHLGFTIWASPNPRGTVAGMTDAYEGISSWAGTGWVGVEIFFVISGFVIAFSANGRSPSAYASSRFLRLFPGVLVCATLSLPALAYFGQPLGQIAHEYARTVLFAPTAPWVAGPYWTLMVEVVFYCVVLVLLCCDRFDLIERVMFVIGGISALFWIAYAISAHSQAEQYLYRFGYSRAAHLSLIRYGVYFAIGVIAWIVHNKGWNASRIFSLGLFGTAALIEINAQAQGHARYMSHPISSVIACGFWLVAMALFAMSIRYNVKIAAVLGHLQTPIRHLGLSTFPLYLLHEPIGIAILLFAWGSLSPFALLLSVIALLLAMSLLVALVLEPALRKFIGGPFDRLEAILPNHWTSLRKATRRF